MWGSDSNLIFLVTSEAVLDLYICFPVEHPYRVFFDWQTDSRSTQKYSSEPQYKKFNGRGYFLGNP